MGPGRLAMLCIFAALLASGCRRDDLPFDDGPTGGTDGEFIQRLSFSWTGLPSSFRTYTKLRAAYSSAANLTTIETTNDSLLFGRVQLAIHGGAPGRYRYRVTGSVEDTNQVFLRFVPQYFNGLPSPEFLLTGRPADSLEAEVTILTFGAPGDTIEGRFAATLALAGGGGTRILMYDGAFTARRTE